MSPFLVLGHYLAFSFGFGPHVGRTVCAQDWEGLWGATHWPILHSLTWHHYFHRKPPPGGRPVRQCLDYLPSFIWFQSGDTFFIPVIWNNLRTSSLFVCIYLNTLTFIILEHEMSFVFSNIQTYQVSSCCRQRYVWTYSNSSKVCFLGSADVSSLQSLWLPIH